MDVKLQVGYYNSDEKDAFEKNYPAEFKALDNIIIKGYIKVPYVDFQTYFLFKHQFEDDPPHYFITKRLDLPHEWGSLRQYFNYNNSTEMFSAIRPSNNGNPEISESLGVGGALASSSKIFLNLTQADWRKLPITSTKDFDFTHLASTGDKYITIEAKGSIVTDNQKLTEISSHKNGKSGISTKKEDPNFKRNYDRNKVFFYGVITASDQLNHTFSRFVDPPFIGDIPMPPEQYKLLARLYYYFDFARIISSRSYIVLALSNRIQSLSISSNYKIFDKQPLINSSFEPLTVTESFVNSKTHSTDRNMVGAIEIFNKEELMFIGLHTEVYKMLIDQSISDINTFRVEPSVTQTQLICKLSSKVFENQIFVELLNFRPNTRDGYYTFNAQANLFVCSSGLVYGRISVNDLRK